MKILSYVLTLSLGIGIGIILTSDKNKSKGTPLTEPLKSVAESAVSTPTRQETKSNGNSGQQKVTEKPQNTGLKNITLIKDDFDQALNQDDLNRAKALLDEMEKTNNKSTQFLEAKSRYLVRTREWDAAKVALKACLQVYPTSKSCLIDLASTEQQVGSKDEQEQAAKGCLSVLKNDPQCLNILAIVRMGQGKYDSAISIYEYLIKNNGGYGVRFPEFIIYSQLGSALEGAGRLQEAIQQFEKACQYSDQQSCQRAETLRGKL